MPEDLVNTYLVTEEQLTNIGDAIREKLDEQTTYTVDAMPGKIASITGGGGAAEVEYIHNQLVTETKAGHDDFLAELVSVNLDPNNPVENITPVYLDGNRFYGIWSTSTNKYWLYESLSDEYPKGLIYYDSNESTWILDDYYGNNGKQVIISATQELPVNDIIYIPTQTVNYQGNFVQLRDVHIDVLNIPESIPLVVNDVECYLPYYKPGIPIPGVEIAFIDPYEQIPFGLFYGENTWSFGLTGSGNSGNYTISSMILKDKPTEVIYIPEQSYTFSSSNPILFTSNKFIPELQTTIMPEVIPITITTITGTYNCWGSYSTGNDGGDDYYYYTIINKEITSEGTNEVLGKLSFSHINYVGGWRIIDSVWGNGVQITISSQESISPDSDEYLSLIPKRLIKYEVDDIDDYYSYLTSDIMNYLMPSCYPNLELLLNDKLYELTYSEINQCYISEFMSIGQFYDDGTNLTEGFYTWMEPRQFAPDSLYNTVEVRVKLPRARYGLLGIGNYSEENIILGGEDSGNIFLYNYEALPAFIYGSDGQIHPKTVEDIVPPKSQVILICLSIDLYSGDVEHNGTIALFRLDMNPSGIIENKSYNFNSRPLYYDGEYSLENINKNGSLFLYFTSGHSENV